MMVSVVMLCKFANKISLILHKEVGLLCLNWTSSTSTLLLIKRCCAAAPKEYNKFASSLEEQAQQAPVQLTE